MFKVKLKSNVVNLSNDATQHFSHVNIKGYKCFREGFKASGFKQINIIAGVANTGKTAFLEAVYLLANLNNPEGLFTMCKERGKYRRKIDGETLEWLLPKYVNIYGHFDNTEYQLKLNKFDSTASMADRPDYRVSYELMGRTKDAIYQTAIKLYSTKTPKIDDIEKRQICPTAFLSSVSALNIQQLEAAYDTVYANGYLVDIIGFLKQHFDNNILSINKVGADKLVRFVVIHKYHGTYDITQLGNSFQQIFYTAVTMASVPNGVIFIDDFDQGIYYKLLQSYAKLIQRLAEELNIQVFLTTQSNECIEAFLNTKNKEAIAGFRLTKDEENNIKCAATSGEAFRTLFHSFAFDLRG